MCEIGWAKKKVTLSYVILHWSEEKHIGAVNANKNLIKYSFYRQFEWTTRSVVLVGNIQPQDMYC